MNNNINDILGNITGPSLNGLSVSLLGLLKFPVIIILFGNVLFAVLLFLRVRILADTFDSPQNSLVKTVVLLYIVGIALVSILALLFLLIG